jgi:hypothetical protein
MSDELIKRIRQGYNNWDSGYKADGALLGEAADLLEQQAARIAELSTCKLCNSTGHDTPCAYPTEINRQQAKRIAALESAQKENGELLSALAECRDAFPVPAAGGELEGHWVSAMANPDEVPAYVKACIESTSKDAIRREAWISVDERLPEEDSVVLVSAWEYGKPDGKRFTLIARLVGSLFLNEETGDDLYTPTHWMSLPEAPGALSQKVGDQK